MGLWLEIGVSPQVETCLEEEGKVGQLTRAA
jgi:hypothetical protein